MDFNSMVISFIVGGLLLLSFLHLTHATNVNKKANIYFGIFLFLWSTFWLDEMIIPEEYEKNSPIIITLRMLQYLVPLTFYMSVKFYTNPRYKYSKKDIWFLIAPSIFFILLLCKPKLNKSIFSLLYVCFFMSHSLFYTVLAYIKVKKHQKNIELFASDTESIDLRWIKYIIYSFIASALLILGYNLFFTADKLNIYINIYFLVVVYLVAHYSIKQKEIYPKGLNINETVINKVSQEERNDEEKIKRVDDRELETIQAAILTLMKEEQPYLDNELNLLKLAEKLNITSHQLSYVLNTGFGENFFYFINKYRVKKAEELLIDSKYDHLTMIAIGYESGFNSKTAFNTTFKKMTTYTPSEYKKNRSKL
ncbi:helix-turn-helix domain-containing protein [Avrilella dinanensis]|uniref:AraC family transcriptional regulator n=1 Tax=Avrilella dinanensis TaxID=2008672 RepID=A0A2M9R384_9FLAO|nr:helix-turn-helix domain-containing protein [Avrilella dinanensis]PJR03319.1 AraC family transcriptional regulator [Avrilella dinanensis]